MRAAALVLALALPAAAQSIRVKEIAAVQGVRTNQLTGYGLVVGLDGTGDQTTQTPFTSQSMNALLQQMGVTMPPSASINNMGRRPKRSEASPMRGVTRITVSAAKTEIDSARVSGMVPVASRNTGT